MLDFYEVWGREILKKRIAISVAFFFGFLLIGGFIYNLFTEVPPKTLADYAYQYVVDRFNYTPENVRSAYFSRYQYRFPGYDIVVEREMEQIRKLKLVSFFRPDKIRRDIQNRNILEVTGTRVTGRLEGGKIVDVNIARTVIILRAVGTNFTVEEVRAQ